LAGSTHFAIKSSRIVSRNSSSHEFEPPLGLEIRYEHRADLHRALAYASLAGVAQVDTLLLYPSMGNEPRRLDTMATVTSGRRRVRLILASVPFGYRSPEHEEADLTAFRELLAG
jgi:hypothetical protein